MTSYKNIQINIKEIDPAFSVHLSEEIRDVIMFAILNGEEIVSISELEYNKALQSKSKQDEINNNWRITAELNNKGIAFEKEGKIYEAIEVYEENLQIGYPASHSFDRLMILYRKLKDYNNEIRVIERALQIAKDDPKYISRLKKVQNLLSK